jgi:DNA invertase Pin-like site-specific DNA recombinase
MKTAIAYVSDIILGRTGEVISRGSQKELIGQYAAANDIQIVEWFEDEMYNEDIMSRPGIQKMLAKTDVDTILVERVWSFSRKWTQLEAFYNELQKRNFLLEASTTLWDALSQMSRRRFDKTIRSPQLAEERVMAASTAKSPVKLAKPKKLNFVFKEPLTEVE